MKKKKIYVTTAIEFEYDEREAGDDRTASSVACDLAANPDYGTVERGVHLLNARLCGREETEEALKTLLGRDDRERRPKRPGAPADAEPDRPAAEREDGR